jgi:uncharacterized repeat protein (TIGR01451 family)
VCSSDLINKIFTLLKDGIPYPAYTFHEGVNTGLKDLPGGSYTIELLVKNQFCTGTNPEPATCKESVKVSKTFTVWVDEESPTATPSRATCPNGESGCPFVGTSRVTVTFQDTGGSGLANQRIAVTTNTTPPPSGNSAWSDPSTSNTKIATLSDSGRLYIHWWAADKAGNEATGTFGPYDLIKDNTSLALTAQPDWGTIEQKWLEFYTPESTPYGTSPLILTAQLGDHDITNTEIGFYLDNVYLGYASVVDGQASYRYSGTLTVGEHTFAAGWGGNGSYNQPPRADLPYESIGSDLTTTLTVTSSPRRNPSVGDIIRVGITVTNIGKLPAENAHVTFTVPAGLTWIHDQAGLSDTEGVDWAGGSWLISKTLAGASPPGFFSRLFGRGAPPPGPDQTADAHAYFIVLNEGDLIFSAQAETEPPQAESNPGDNTANTLTITVNPAVPACWALDGSQ